MRADPYVGINGFNRKGTGTTCCPVASPHEVHMLAGPHQGLSVWPWSWTLQVSILWDKWASILCTLFNLRYFVMEIENGLRYWLRWEIQCKMKQASPLESHNIPHWASYEKSLNSWSPGTRLYTELIHCHLLPHLLRFHEAQPQPFPPLFFLETLSHTHTSCEI